MHGMICKGLEAYVAASHGPEVWHAVARGLPIRDGRFETLLVYDDGIFAAALASTARHLDRSEAAVMEDLGAWLCTEPSLESVRRLLRFCGTSFRAFLLSLEELEARARMAIPELVLPSCRVGECRDGNRYDIQVEWPAPCGGSLVAGVLHAMASDHGALALIELGPCQAGPDRRETIAVTLVREGFHRPRAFDLATGSG